jgi:hypothetical protein
MKHPLPLQSRGYQTHIEMATRNAGELDELEDLEGRILVRKFTDELTGKTTLEHAAKSAQRERDALAEARLRSRRRELFQDNENESV